MKRAMSIALIAVLATLLSSCSLDSLWARYDAQELANAQFTRMIEAINSGDPEQLKAEFSNRVVIDHADLDSEIARLYELLPDGVWSWREGGCSEGSEGHAGPVEIYVNCSYVIVLDSTTPVHVSFMAHNYNTWDPENVGIYSLSVTTGDDEAPPLDEERPWDGQAPGLYVSDSAPIVGARL